MKRVFFSIIPTILLAFIIILLYLIENLYMNSILDIFHLSDTSSINTFNIFLLYALGILGIYILSKYTMEINERSFRIFTFILNAILIIVLICVLQSSGFLYWE